MVAHVIQPDGLLSWDQFVKEERTSLDTVDFKKVYVDMTGDLVAGAMLSQVVYWHLPSAKGATRLRVHKEGRLWWAVSRQEWAHQIRITPRQADRGLKIMEERGLVQVSIFKFDGVPTTHIWLDQVAFLVARHHAQNVGCAWIKGHTCAAVKSTLPNGDITAAVDPSPQEVISISPNGDFHFTAGGGPSPQTVRSITETTTETTTETPDRDYNIIPDTAPPLGYGAVPEMPPRESEETESVQARDSSQNPIPLPPSQPTETANGWTPEELERLKGIVAKEYPSSGPGGFRPGKAALDALSSLPRDRANDFVKAVKHYAYKVQGEESKWTRGLVRFMEDGFWEQFITTQSKAGKSTAQPQSSGRDVNGEADAVSHKVKMQNVYIPAFDKSLLHEEAS